MQEYPAGKVCRVLQIPRSTLYHRRRHGGRRPVYKDEEKLVIYEAFQDHHGSFGRRMLKPILAEKGIHISERKIARILKELGLRAKYGRRKGKNIHTSKETEKYIHENLFAQMDETSRKNNEIWSMDFTEEKFGKKIIYTCGIISVNRKILVGYAQANKCTTALAIRALQSAVEQYGKPYMVMTDRGSQFTSKGFYDMMETLEILHSMSRPHKPVDNRFIETFWKSMKVEMGKLNLLTENTYKMVVDYYIYYYNNLRPHSTLGYRPPLAA